MTRRRYERIIADRRPAIDAPRLAADQLGPIPPITADQAAAIRRLVADQDDAQMLAHMMLGED